MTNDFFHKFISPEEVQIINTKKRKQNNFFIIMFWFENEYIFIFYKNNGNIWKNNITIK